MTLTFCNLTKKYVALRYCEMIDGKCPHRHHRVWNNKTELAWDKERPQQEGEFTIKRPMACQLNDATIIHRYSKE